MPTGTGTISLTKVSPTKTTDFDGLSNTAGSTTNTTLPIGWYITEDGGGARDNEQYAVDTGSSTTGDIYSYGAAANTERALGELRSGTLIPTFGAFFTNNTGETITSLDISYDGEQWRYGGSHTIVATGVTVPDRLDFQYSLNATDLSTGTWTDVNALDFNPPVTSGSAGALVGNNAANRVAGIAATISGLSIAPGASFWIRWTDADAGNSDDGLAVDNFSITPHTIAVGAPTLTIADVTQAETNGATTFTFTVSLNGAAPVGGVTFDIATADGTATTANGDYVARSLTGQTIAEGSTSYTFDVTVNGDAVIEANESFFVNVTNVTGATVGDGQAQGTITNDDTPVLTIADVSHTEGDSGATTYTFTVGLDRAAPFGGVTFDIATADSSATAGSDYVARTLTTQTIAEGQTSYTFDVTVNGDTAVEPNETFLVNVTNVAGATVGDGQAQGTITNDDVNPVPAATVADMAIVEGASGVSYLVFTVTLNIAAPSAVTIDYATSNGTATAGSDYLATSGTLTFAPGESSKTVSVPVIGDTIPELNETLTLTLSNPSGATLADGVAIGTITSDEAPGYFSLASGTFSENWTDTSRITANDDWSGVPYVRGYLGDIDTAGAQTGVDPRTLTGANLGQIDVIANQAAATSTSGGVGEFFVAPNNPTIGLQGSGTADAPSIVVYMDARGQQNVRLTATLRDIDGSADDATQQVAVQYRTDPNGTWTNVTGGYFSDVTTGGSATQTTALDVTLPAAANNAPTLEIRILTTNAAGNDEWVGIDDIVVTSAAGAPSYSIADSAAYEGNAGTTPISFTVTRAGDASAAGTVDYSVTFPGGGFSASAGDLASALTGTVSFNAGEASKALVLQIAGDTTPEADEAFTITLSNPSAGGVLGDAGATGTIVNDDATPPFVTIADVAQAEGDSGTSIMTFTVTRTGGTGAFTVDYATVDGTATTGGGDYVGKSGTLSFAAGENSKTVAVTVNGDTTPESTEAFGVNLSNPTGFAVLADPSAIGTITNDDITAIHDIQGSGHTSPVVGQSVKTQGIVTAIDSNGYYIQDPNPDADVNTSEGVFVFTGTAPTGVALGDLVQVTGNVTEFVAGAGSLSVTEVSTSGAPSVISTGNALPAATIIGQGGRLPPTENGPGNGFGNALAFYESMEGMRVTVKAPLVVQDTNSFGETWVLASGGAGATGVDARGGITISAGDLNPERIQIDNDANLSPGYNPTHTQGDILGDVTGIMNYSNSSYEVLVTGTVTTTTDVTLPQETTTLQGDATHLTVASYNVENLDIGDGQQKFNILAGNIVNNLLAPDIIALQEVQDADGPGAGTDYSGTVTAQKLIDAIAAAGGPNYLYLEIAPTANNTNGGEPNGNIRPGFLYNPARVSYITGSAEQITDSAFNGSRKPLVAQFSFNGETVMLIDVHFTSRLGSDELEGSVQPPADAGDGSRTAQGSAVRAFVNDTLATDPSLKIGVFGDFNGFYFEGAVGALEAGGVMTDLHRLNPVEERYSYVFDGNSQAIDQAVVTQNLATGAQLDPVHLNSEYLANANRPTDHDPIVARFAIAGNAPVLDLDANNSTATGTAYAASYIEGGAAAAVADTDVSITDADSGDDIVSATITITNAVAGDTLDVGALPGTVSLDGNSTATMVKLTAAPGTSAADFQTAIKAVTYSSSSDDPTAHGTNNARTVTVVVNDGTSNSNVATATIAVTDANDAPAGANSTITAAEDSYRVLTTADLGFSDVDGTLGGVTISGVTGGKIYFDADGTAGAGAPAEVVLPKTYTAQDLADGKVSFKANANANGNGIGSITFTVSDDDGASAASSNTLTVNVTAANDSPVVPDSPPVSENEGSSVVLNPALVVSDVDLDARNGGSGDYGGAQFVINRSGGGNPQDQFILSNATAVGFTVTGSFLGGGDLQAGGQTFGNWFWNSSTGVMTVNFTSSQTPATTARVNAVLQAIEYNVVSDTPPASVNLVYTLNDGSPGGGQGSGAAATDSGAITVNITATNDAPWLDLLDPGASTDVTLTYVENDAATVLAPTATVSDPDLQDFDGGKLTVNLNSTGRAEDRLTITNQGMASGQVGVSGSNVYYGGALIGTFTGGTSGSTPLIVTFNASADQTAVIALVRAISYANVSDNPNPSDRTIGFDLTDGDGGQSNLATATVHITSVDDAALARPDAVSTPENAIGTGSLFANNGSGPDSDAEGDTFQVTAVSGGSVGVPFQLPSGAILTVNSDGTYSYDPNGKFNWLTDGSSGAVNTSTVGDTFTYTVTGGSTATVTVTVNGVAGPGDELRGDGGDNTVTGTPGGDLFLLQQGGDDHAYGLGAKDVFYYGSALTAADVNDGGGGVDVLVLQGNYDLTLGAGSLTNIEALSLQSGSNTRWGDTANNFYHYDITTANENVDAGAKLIVNASNLRAGENFTFDGSAETDGFFFIYAGAGVDDLTGGAQGDIFYFDAGTWGASDIVDGGAGRDVVIISAGNGLNHIEFGAGTLTNVEALSVSDYYASDPTAKPSYEFVIDDGNVIPGGTLIVNGSTLGATQTFDVDAHDVTGSLRLFGGAGNDVLRGGSASDTLYGGERGDTLAGGAGADVFQYRSVTESDRNERDGIQDFSAGDLIDLSYIDADTTQDGNQAFHFIGTADFGNHAGELRFENQGGNIWLVQADTDGIGGSDFEVLVQIIDNHPLTASDFML